MSSILEILPNEILEQIWKEALVRNVIDITPVELSPPQPGDDAINKPKTFHATNAPAKERLIGTSVPPELSALLLTCRHLYGGAIRIFFSYNDFRISVSESTLGLPVRWLASLPKEGRSQIRKLTIISGAGNGNILSSLMQKPASFDSMSMSCLVSAPQILRANNARVVSSALKELKAVGDFAHSTVTFRFEREAAGSLEWSSWRSSWAQCLHDTSNIFTVPEKEVLGEDAYKRIVCTSHCPCASRRDLTGEALKVQARRHTWSST